MEVWIITISIYVDVHRLVNVTSMLVILMSMMMLVYILVYTGMWTYISVINIIASVLFT